MIGSRLKEARKKAGKSQKDVVEAVGITQSALSQLENGLVASSAHLPSIANFLNVNAYWLQTGNNVPNLQPVKVWDENTPLEDDEVEVPFFKDFSFACGYGSVCDIKQTPTEKLRLPKITLRNRGIQYNQSVAAMASGESMSPTIKDGDTVHIDLGKKTIKDGKVFAICHGGLFMIKRLYNLPMGGIRVVSDNAVEFPEIRLTSQEVADQQFEIVGWIWQISSLENW